MSHLSTMIPDTYEIISQEYIEEIQSEATLLRHRKTGARVAVISNQDENKVFNIAFRTPPADSTGVPHIMEHSVLCGSKNFPAKDPFIELAKGSLNTFLNAMTYPDKTMYPVASCNDADFQNLMHVYLDAVFYPNIYKHDKIFKQEGWHYEVAEDDSIFCNGVVYNEMKGAYSSPESILDRYVCDSLYPDTIYRNDSGGNPDVIPQLTYEQFCNFHRTYYHPSNAYIYLYGNMDVVEKLNFIDREYLNDFDHASINSVISGQTAFSAVQDRTFSYSVPEDEETEDASNSYLSYSWCLGEQTDTAASMAFQILNYVLLDAAGAPLKKALLDAQIGEDIYGEYETSIKQPLFSIVIKNIAADQKDEACVIITETLARLASEGINRRTLEGALNTFEFKAREADFGRWPKGLMYGLQMFDTWLYDENRPFDLLKYQPDFDKLRAGLDTGYFEQLIREKLIDNTHAVRVMLVPEKGLDQRKEQCLKEKMEAFKASLTEIDFEQIREDMQALKDYQSEPSTKEELEMIPLLSIDDIRKEAEPLWNTPFSQDGIRYLHHAIETNKIAYFRFLFDVSHIQIEDIPYLGILSEVIGNTKTEHYSEQQLTDEINMYTGGITTSVKVSKTDASDAYSPTFEINGKVLYTKINQAFALTEEMLMRTDFKDHKRIKEVLNQIKSRLEMGFVSNGHTTAVSRAASYYSSAAWFTEMTEGIAFYQKVCELIKDFDQQADHITVSLQRVAELVFRKERMLADITADEEGKECFIIQTGQMAEALYRRPLTECESRHIMAGTCPTVREAFIIPGMVQYNACAANFVREGLDYEGSLNVLKNILSTEYLWNNVRVKGGAYGCMCGFGVSGDGYLVSYRDPNLTETYDVYLQAADYVQKITLDERERTKYIIGAIGSIDLPLTPAMKGERSLRAYLAERTLEMIQKTRDQLLGTTCEDLRNLSQQVRVVAESKARCVVGSESSIMKNQQQFDHVIRLIQ